MSLDKLKKRGCHNIPSPPYGDYWRVYTVFDTVWIFPAVFLNFMGISPVGGYM